MIRFIMNLLSVTSNFFQEITRKKEIKRKKFIEKVGHKMRFAELLFILILIYYLFDFLP